MFQIFTPLAMHVQEGSETIMLSLGVMRER